MYMIYFELFGHKMKYKVEANSEHEAKQKVLNEVKFHKVNKLEDPTEFERVSDDKVVNDLLNIFGIKK